MRQWLVSMLILNCYSLWILVAYGELNVGWLDDWMIAWLPPCLLDGWGYCTGNFKSLQIKTEVGSAIDLARGSRHRSKHLLHWYKCHYLVVTTQIFFDIFYVHHFLGKWSNLTSIYNIFQVGWFNHQQDYLATSSENKPISMFVIWLRLASPCAVVILCRSSRVRIW